MTIKERVAEMVQKFAVQLAEETKAKEADQAEAKLAAAMLDNGQEIQTSAEAFAEGADVFVVNDEGEQIPLPDGDYTLEDGTTFSVMEGIISAMGAAEVEEAAKEEEMSAETEVEEPAVEAALSREEVQEMIASAIKEATTQLSAEIAEKNEQIEKLSAQPAAKLSRVKEAKKFTNAELAQMSVRQRVRALSN
jgi:hypothetical protein